MKSFARISGLSLVLFSLAGCGLRGPLYLPDEQQEAVPAAESTPAKPVFEGSKVRTLPPAPQSQKKDREQRQRDSEPPPPSQSQPTPVSPPDPDRPATPPPQPGQ